jgi:hypothetical protein
MTDPHLPNVVRALTTARDAEGDQPWIASIELADAIWLAQRLTPTETAAAGPVRPPGRSAGSATPPDADPTASSPASLVLPTTPGGTGPWRGQPVHVPDTSALPGSLAIARELRRLKRNVPARYREELDEDATATAIAESRLSIPIMKPATERWLELDLVVDSSSTMQIWDQTVSELTELLGHHGAFRAIRTWQVDADTDAVELRAYRRSGEVGSARSPLELVDVGGRRAILLVTDGVGAAWRNGAMEKVLARWRTATLVTIINVLPVSMWFRTNLAPLPVYVTAEHDEGRVARMRMQPRGITESLDFNASAATLVVPLDSDGLGMWAALATGTIVGSVPATAAAARTDDDDDDGPERTEVSATVQVAQFQAAASSDAFMLACWLAVPVLNIPVMRLVQRAMMPRTSVMVLAEVLLSGLIKRTSSPGGDGEAATYGFADSVREILLDYLTSDEALAVKRVLDRVASAIDLGGGSIRTFPAVLTDGQTASSTGAAHRSFAVLSPAAAKKLRRIPRQRVAPTQDHEPTFELDPNAPLVFLSYARNRDGRRPGHTEMRFFENLVEVLSEFGPWPEPAFIDMNEGDAYARAETLLAAGTCQVFIPLLSAAYVRNALCAQEWDLFRRRRIVTRPESGPTASTCVLPVLWSAFQAPPPIEITEIQQFMPDPAYAGRYTARGLAELQSSDRSVYEVIVWQLALQIARVVAAHWVEPLVLSDAGPLTRTFRARGNHVAGKGNG